MPTLLIWNMPSLISAQEGKGSLTNERGKKKLFLVDLSERNLCINAKAGS